MSRFLNLPAELKLAIVGLVDTPYYSFVPRPNPDIASLSCVCKQLREISLPILFRKITLSNNEKSGGSVRAILSSTGAKLVYQLHYIGTADIGIERYNGGFVDNSDEDSPALGEFPESVDYVLSNLTGFPNLKKLIMEFRDAETRGDTEDDNYLDSFYAYDEPENDQDVLRAESNDFFRSMMNGSYRAIATNRSSTITALELKNMVPKECSTWQTPAFNELLQGLTSFAISIRGGDNGAGWRINTLDGYQQFVESLGNYFFQHLENIQHFSYSGNNDGPPGLHGFRHMSMGLQAEQVPKLHELRVKNIFISQELLSFIEGHRTSLSSIELEDCYSGLGCFLAEDSISWDEFLFRLGSISSGSTIKEVSITCRIERIQPENFESEHEWKYPEAVQARQLRKIYPGRRMFDYATLDDKYGMLFSNEEKSFETFEGGSDHTAWIRLQSILGNNT